MKKMKSDLGAGWSAQADRSFISSPLGSQVLALLESGSRSQRRLSDFVLRDPVFVATHGIEDLAKQSEISPSTISRYVRDLGMTNYAEFRSAIAETVHSLIAPVTKLGDRFSASDPGDGVAEASLSSAFANLQFLQDAETADALRKVSARLAQARNVWIIGFGLSAHLAAMLTLGIQPYRENVVNVVQYGGTEAAAARLMTVGPEDLVIAIAFPRYSADIGALGMATRDAGAYLVAITDSTAAPLARIADQVLLSPAQHPVLSSSSLPGLALIEALVSEFLLSDPANVKRAGKLAAVLSAYLTPRE